MHISSKIYDCGVAECMNGDIRLVDSVGNSTGRVEFCHNHKWTIVGDDIWDVTEATVACRQLELPTDGM